MSGHSHFKSIKHKKGAADAQRSKVFSKMAGEIAIAAREGGGDPGGNPRLRMAMDRARSFNMPTANIERAIKRGTGEEAGSKLEEVLFEGYGPGNIAVLVEGITDNKNRTLGEIKQAFEKNQGKLVGEGQVKWLFERRGALALDPKNQDREELGLLAIEAGAEDLYWRDQGSLELYTKPAELEAVKKALEEKGVAVESTALEWVPKERLSLSQNDKEAAERLFEALDENEAVQEIYANLR